MDNGKIRAKMLVNNVTNFIGGQTVKLGAVYSADPESENKAFTQYTPSASIEIQISGDAPAFGKFEIGKEYYVDFTKAE